MNDQSACCICQGKLVPKLEGIIDPATSEGFVVDKCDSCGLGVTSPVPEELGTYYGADYHGQRHGVTTKICDSRRVRITASACDQRIGKLLDVGCGDGTFLKAAEASGWTVAGVERFPEHSRQLGLTVFETISSASAGCQFDCVTMWHCLEHLADLDDAFASIKNVLHPEGCLLIAVPNWGSLQSRIFGRHWLHLDVPRHLYHFSHEAIRKLADKHQFETRRMPQTEWEYDLMGWIQSMLNATGFRRDLLLKLLMGRAPVTSTLEKFTNLALGSIVGSCAFVPTAIGGISGHGGTLIMRLEHSPESRVK
jgi:SAM-dependent methyltransferase